MFTLTFGETIRIARMRKGISAKDLSLKIGYSSNYITKIELGHDSFVPVNIIKSLASMLEIEEDTLAHLCNMIPPTAGELIRAYPTEMKDLCSVISGLDRERLRALINKIKEMVL